MIAESQQARQRQSCLIVTLKIEEHFFKIVADHLATFLYSITISLDSLIAVKLMQN